jgi:hypothetical protein
VRKAVGLAVFVALALGCGSAGGGTAATGLKGKVMRGPIQPVCRVDEPCDEPARNTKLLFYRSGKLVARATTNQRGWYRVTLKPGAYGVRTNRPSKLEKVPAPSRVRVPKDRIKRVDFHIDTGIR